MVNKAYVKARLGIIITRVWPVEHNTNKIHFNKYVNYSNLQWSFKNILIHFPFQTCFRNYQQKMLVCPQHHLFYKERNVGAIIFTRDHLQMMICMKEKKPYLSPCSSNQNGTRHRILYNSSASLLCMIFHVINALDHWETAK